MSLAHIWRLIDFRAGCTERKHCRAMCEIYSALVPTSNSLWWPVYLTCNVVALLEVYCAILRAAAVKLRSFQSRHRRDIFWPLCDLYYGTHGVVAGSRMLSNTRPNASKIDPSTCLATWGKRHQVGSFPSNLNNKATRFSPKSYRVITLL